MRQYLLLVCAAALRLSAEPTPTPILDVIHTGTGTYFKGQAKISWPAFTAYDGSQVARGSVTVPIIASGRLSTMLVPTSNALSPATYTVLFTSASAVDQYTETWDVPPAAGPLNIGQIKVVVTAPPTKEIAIGDYTPTGALDGTNPTFLLSARPEPLTSLLLFHNGLLMRRGADYAVAGATITFLPAAIPQPGAVLAAWFTRRL